MIFGCQSPIIHANVDINMDIHVDIHIDIQTRISMEGYSAMDIRKK